MSDPDTQGDGAAATAPASDLDVAVQALERHRAATQHVHDRLHDVGEQARAALDALRASVRAAETAALNEVHHARNALAGLEERAHGLQQQLAVLAEQLDHQQGSHEGALHHVRDALHSATHDASSSLEESAQAARHSIAALESDRDRLIAELERCHRSIHGALTHAHQRHGALGHTIGEYGRTIASHLEAVLHDFSALVQISNHAVSSLESRLSNSTQSTQIVLRRAFLEDAVHTLETGVHQLESALGALGAGGRSTGHQVESRGGALIGAMQGVIHTIEVIRPVLVLVETLA